MSGFAKVPTGIKGLDEILAGGLPRNRATLLTGGPGCGKTAMALEFVARGARDYGEPGVFVSFEEAGPDLLTNIDGWDLGLAESVEAGQVSIRSVLARGRPAVEAGEFTLDGLLVRLEHWIDTIGARRLVLDSLDGIFARLPDSAQLRYELSRIVAWTRERGITTLITMAHGPGGPTRHGFEAHVVDCVLFLDHRVEQQVAKRRIRVMKFRGTTHGADEYPFLITPQGVSVFPITSLALDVDASTEKVSSGLSGLDDLLGGRGLYRGSTVLCSGGPGAGKSTLAAAFASSVCEAGGRALYLAFEESASEITRNMLSVGIDLASHIAAGKLRIEPVRPTAFGLEEHLLRVHQLVEAHPADGVVLDPITGFTPLGGNLDVASMLTRLLDYLKGRGTTVFLTGLTPGGREPEQTETMVSSIVDALIILRHTRVAGVRHRRICVHKARGLPHSDEARELVLSADGPAVVPFPDATPGGEG